MSVCVPVCVCGKYLVEVDLFPGSDYRLRRTSVFSAGKRVRRKSESSGCAAASFAT